MLGPPADYRPISKHDRANQQTRLLNNQNTTRVDYGQPKRPTPQLRQASRITANSTRIPPTKHPSIRSSNSRLSFPTHISPGSHRPNFRLAAEISTRLSAITCLSLTLFNHPLSPELSSFWFASLHLSRVFIHGIDGLN